MNNPLAVPLNSTIPQLVHKCAKIDRIAMIYDAEVTNYTFEKIANEMDRLAAGLLSTGLEPGDHVLICGSNTANFMITSLACTRAGLIFSLSGSNFANAQQLQYILMKGEFRAIICFAATRAELLNGLLNQLSPELRSSVKGRLKSETLPKLSHVILAEEDHKHAGTFTLSEIYNRSSRERIEKLPNFNNWDTNQLAAIQFTAGSSGKPKLVGLTHYQLLNGCRVAAETIGLDEKVSCVACALPLFKISVFAVIGLAPFISQSRIVYPSASPIPKYLFESVNKYQCTHLLSNAVALHLILKVAATKKLQMSSVSNVILLGERVTSELIANINKYFDNAKTIVMNIKEIGKLNDGSKIGELLIQPVNGSRFLGYQSPFDCNSEWINTNDLVKLNENGDIELIANSDDLIIDSKSIIEHWLIEKAICGHNQIKGAQASFLASKNN